MTRRKHSGGNSERERFWQGVILEQKSSGLSISAFCRNRDVSPASFFSWRRRLTQRPGNDTAQKFVPVTLHAPLTATRPGCEVVLPDGCRILVPTGCDANWLCEILEALRGSPSC
jgi:transposase-like protein